ncbi:MAG: bacterial Ig-like domain-containing protein [Clostridia bacterium]|nr:bacterial Ig-like domain-containing protein [Clostridia bacterium]
MQKPLKTTKALISFLLVIFMLWSVMAVSVNASGTERIYSVPDVLHNAPATASLSSNDTSLKTYLRTELAKTPYSLNLRNYNISVEKLNELGSLIYDTMPELFHIVGLKCSVSSWNTILDLYPVYNCTATEYKTKSAKVFESAEKILEGVKDNKNLSAVQKALLIHDRLAVICEYDSKNLETGKIPEDSFTMYGVLANGIAVCQGYSEAYLYLLEKVGIKSYICESEVMNHAWNIVEIGGVEYHVDVTWDDPTYDVTGRVTHTNFLRSSQGIYSTGHKATDYYSAPADTRYDNAFWQDSDAEFQLLGNEIYYIDNKNAQIKKYSDKSAVISVEDRWAASATSFWKGNFSYLSSDGVHLLYNKSDAVYMFDFSTNKETKIWTPDKSALPNMSIYGFTYRNGRLICDIYTTPNYCIDTKDRYQQQKVWKTICDVTIDKMPKKTEYYIGDKFNSEGLSLRVTYADGSYDIVTSGYSIDSYDTNRAGETSVKVSISGRCVVVPIKVSTPSITLSATDILLEAGESKQLTATTKPAGQTVVWISGHNNVSVSRNGTVTAIAEGKAVIVAQFVYNGITYSAKCTVESGCPHSSKTYYPAKESTCTQHGHTEYSVCNDCGVIISGSKTELPFAEHSYVDYEAPEYLAVRGSCTAPALYYKSCSECGNASDVTFRSEHFAPHKEVVLPAKVPTCTETGLTEGSKCSVCQQIVKPQTVIKKSEHITVTLPGKDATYTETGLTEGEMCAVCGLVTVEQKEIPKIERPGHIHTYITFTTPPTCENEGFTTYTCYCGKKYTADVTSATGHKEEKIPGTPATETHTGLTDGIRCSVCKKILSAQHQIPILGHEVVVLEGKAPTCTETGLTEGQSCVTCGGIVEPQQVIPATGHDEEILPSEAPSCLTTGMTQGAKCKKCGEITVPQSIIAAKGHSLISVVKNPTCTMNGYTIHTCTVCDYSHKTAETHAKGHTPGEWIVTIVPQNDRTGLEAQFCSVCGYKLAERVITETETDSKKLQVTDNAFIVDDSLHISIIGVKSKVGSVSESIVNKKFEIVDKKGNKLGKDDYIGTGSAIQILDENRNLLNIYIVVVVTDVDGNGKTTAADARLALRGSAKLETIEGVYAKASDVTNDNKITAADARKILRISAGLEKP